MRPHVDCMQRTLWISNTRATLISLDVNDPGESVVVDAALSRSANRPRAVTLLSGVFDKRTKQFL